MAESKLKLMAILAHPDDESLGFGGSIIKYANEGIDVYLITATRGERGRYGMAKVSPGLKVVGAARQAELLAAAEILRIKEVIILDYLDGDLDQAPPDEIIPDISRHIRLIRPDVILTFGMQGAYGHEDHIAISQFTSAAITQAANPYFKSEHPPHTVSKLYWKGWTQTHWDAYQAAFKKMSRTLDGVERFANPVPDWAITTWVDARAYWKQVYAAVKCHKTQIAVYENLEKLSEDQHAFIWGSQSYYRVMSLVNGGRKIETDLFEGLR